MSDARAGAWLVAWDRLEAAQKLKEDHKGRLVQPLPELYWSVVAESQIYADLASAPQIVGSMVGTYMEDRERQRLADREHLEATLAKITKTAADD